MTPPLRVLIVEDSEPDAQLMLHLLAEAGHAVESSCVDTEDAFRETLADGT